MIEDPKQRKSAVPAPFMGNPPPLSRRHFLTLVGGSVAMMGLAACGGDDDDSAGTTPTSDGTTDSGSTSPSTAPSASTEQQTIHVFDFDPTGIEAWVAADEAFGTYFSEEHPNISVERTKAGFVGYAESLLTSVAGGAKYDVIYGWAPWLPQFVENDVVSSLDSFLTGGDLSADDFHDYGKDVSGGQVYGLAWYASAQYMYYNRGRVADAGLDDPAELDAAGNWTYEQLRSHAEALSDSGSAPNYGFDMGITRGTGDFSAFSRGWGSDIWGPNFSESLMDSPENIELWSWIQGFYRDELTPLPTEGSGLADPVGFGDERIRMMISGANYCRQAEQQGVSDRIDIGMVRIPKGPGGQSHVAYLNSYFMGSRGDNAAGGWEWYKERTFSDRALDLYADTGASRFPVRKSQEPVTRYEWEQPDLYQQIGEDMYPVPVAPEQTRFDELYGAKWDLLSLQQGTAEELLTELADEVNELIADRE